MRVALHQYPLKHCFTKENNKTQSYMELAHVIPIKRDLIPFCHPLSGSFDKVKAKQCFYI